MRKVCLFLAIRTNTGLDYYKSIHPYEVYRVADDYKDLMDELREIRENEDGR